LVVVVMTVVWCYQSSRLFQALVQHYQEEGWWPLLNDVLESALVCEQDLANAPGYFTYALQLLPAGSAHLTYHQKAMLTLPLLTLFIDSCTEMTASLKRKQQIQANIVAALVVRTPSMYLTR
jgi:hypothetical protein